MIIRNQFIKEMAQRGDMKVIEAERLFDLFLDTLKYCIKEYGGVKFRGFGNFVVKEYSERKGRNPKNGNPAVIPNYKTVKFHVGEVFKNSLNE